MVEMKLQDVHVIYLNEANGWYQNKGIWGCPLSGIVIVDVVLKEFPLSSCLLYEMRSYHLCC